jgi:hypothetical protein
VRRRRAARSPPQFSRATRRHSPRAALPHLAAFPCAQTQPQAPNLDGSIVVIGEATNAPPFSLVPCRLDLLAPAPAGRNHHHHLRGLCESESCENEEIFFTCTQGPCMFSWLAIAITT